MNIFALYEDPQWAAGALCDNHVINGVVESAQILSTVARRRGLSLEPSLYRAVHLHSGCVRWAGHCADNYEWLARHFVALCREYHIRFNKVHKCERLVPHFERALREFEKLTRFVPMTPFHLAMPDVYKITVLPSLALQPRDRRGDVLMAASIWSYRNYYYNEKVNKGTGGTYCGATYPLRVGRSLAWCEHFQRFARDVSYYQVERLSPLESLTLENPLLLETSTVRIVDSNTFLGAPTLWTNN